MNHRALRRMGALMAAVLVAGSLAVAADVPAISAAPTPSVTVTPTARANAAGQALALTGSNVSTTANGGIGIYVAFGPNPSSLPADWRVNAGYYQNVAWVHPGGTGTSTNQPLQPDGTFAFNLTRADGSPLTAIYTGSAGTFDCTQIECGAITMTAHGVPDPTQDTFTPVSFDPEITTTTLPATNRTQSYSQTVAAEGGTAPYTWSIDSGSLPSGLTLNTSTGVISGSTAAAAPGGTSNFTVAVTDSSPVPQTDTQALSILVRTPTVTVVPAADANPSGQTFTVSGSGFNPNAPVPGGPTGTGSYVAFGPNPTLLPASPAFYQSTSYYQVAVWARLNPPSVTDGQKAMNADGTFSFTFTTGGSPRALTALYTTSTGTYDCTQIQCGIVTFRSQGNADRSQDTFTPVTFAGGLSVSTTSLPGGRVGEVYSRPLSAAGGTEPYTWAVTAGSLPAGVNLNAATGVLSGTPTTAATSSFTVQVTDSSASPQTASRALSIAVGHTANAAAAKVGTPYSSVVPVPAGVAPYTYALKSGALPPGVTLKPATGVLSGTPTTSGAFKATVAVTDSKAPRPKKTNVKVEIAVAPVAIVLSPASLPAASLNVAYSRQLAAAGGVAPYKFTLAGGVLPSGVKLSAKGELKGKPKARGTSSFVVRAMDKNGFSGTRSYSLTVN